MDRRAFLYGTMASIGTALMLVPGRTRPAAAAAVEGLRGSIDDVRPTAAALRNDDRSDEIQAAADKAAAEGRPLFLPAGRFEISNLTLASGLTVIGVPGQTRLVYTGGGRLMSALGGRGISVDGIVFDGANRSLADETGGLIDFTEVEDLSFSRCDILGSNGHGLTLARVSGRVSLCRISGARGVGIASTEGRGVDIADNQIADCGGGGVLVQRWSEADDGTAVTGNRIDRVKAIAGSGGHGAGVEVFRASGVTIEANRISDSAGAAIAIAAAPGAQIVGNQCRRSAGAGIVATAASDGAMIANNVVDGAMSGVVVSGNGAEGRLAAISGNLVRNVAVLGDDPASGIGIHVDAAAAITGNVVETAARIGLRLGWGASLRDVVASANVIRDSATGIGVSVVEGVGRTVVTANMITAARDGGIRGMRWQDFVTAELSADAAAGYPGLVLEKNQIG